MSYTAYGQDLDFENGFIRIMDSKNKANRIAFMTGAVKEMLKTRLPENLGDYVFKERETGGRIKVVSQTFDKVIERMGFNKGIEDRRYRVVFHTLRHTFASWLAIQGTAPMAIKELLGHRTLATTERYSHLIPDMKKQAVLTLEANFNESRNKKIIPIEAAKEIIP